MQPISKIVLAIGIGFILFRKWKNLWAFFQPDKFWDICMTYDDGSTSEWLHFRKKMSLKYFTHVKEEYYPDFSTHYYHKKVRRFYHREHTREGISLDKEPIQRNTVLENKLFDEKWAGMFDTRPMTQGLWEDYGFYIILGGVAIAIYLYMKQNGLI